MSAKYGINIELSSKATQNITISSSNPIAIIGDDTQLQALSLFNNITEALAKVGDGSIKNALLDLNTTNLHSQIIISPFNLKDNDRSSQNSINECLKAIANLKKCEQDLGVKPKFLLCTEYNDSGVYEALKGLSEVLRAVYTIELNSNTESEILKELKSIQTQRAIITYQKVQRIDKVTRPASAFIIASYAKIMASSEYGFAKTYSNKVIDGIISVIDSVEYLQGIDCEADRLRGEGITCIIVDEGIRAWGGENRDNDFKSLHEMVIYDKAIEAIFKSQKQAIDKQIKDVLGEVIDSLNAFYRKLIGNNVIVGFSIEIPTDINTSEEIAEGKIYIIHKTQAMPLLKNITNKIYKVTEYSDTLIKEIA